LVNLARVIGSFATGLGRWVRNLADDALKFVVEV
jgi:hypothetical protein